jgi:hypothetical protein
MQWRGPQLDSAWPQRLELFECSEETVSSILLSIFPRPVTDASTFPSSEDGQQGARLAALIRSFFLMDA